MQPLQVKLGRLLDSHGAPDEVVRRYLKAVYTFGPGRQGAEAWYRIGAFFAANGEPGNARLAWRHLLREYPTRGHKECMSSFLALRDGLGDPEAEWLERARAGLRELPPRPTVAKPRWLPRFDPIRVREGDPGKGARRQLALAIHELRFGMYRLAVRDALKVVSLHHGSPYIAEARTLAGVALYRLDHAAGAMAQWDRVCADFSGTRRARDCAAAMRLAHPTGARVLLTRPLGMMPPFAPSYRTHADRGMTYAWELYQAGLTLPTLKEYLKVLVGIYGRHRRHAEIRFRAGVCLDDIKLPAAAVVQWRRCVALDAEGPWGERARAALTTLDSPPFPDAEARERFEIPETFPPLPKTKGGVPQCVKRYRLGEELLATGVEDGRQGTEEFLKVLTVTKITKNARWLLTAAEVREAQSLLLAGRSDLAREHLRRAAAAKGPPQYVEQAKRLLAAIDSGEVARP